MLNKNTNRAKIDLSIDPFAFYDIFKNYSLAAGNLVRNRERKGIRMNTEQMFNDSSRRGRPIEVVIVGAGHRSLLYASYALKHPDKLVITGVVDPDPIRRQKTAERFDLAADQCFESVEQLTALPRTADAAINGTMDQLHVRTTLPLLKAGYHVLLEKPIATSQEELLSLYEAAKQYKRTVMICHVLRYAPFYRQIREVIDSGKIGDVVHIQTNEHVSYHHMAVAYIRGKWNSIENGGSSMLMAKCSHDLDLISWFSGSRPTKVSSAGSLTQFKPENAPEGAGTRCLKDCAIEATCPYSAKKNYIEQGKWGFYVWGNTFLGIHPSEEEKLRSLREDNPYGRCVWHSDNDVVDHQSVVVEFENGCVATHNMVGGTSRPSRAIHITGTKGEIEGVLQDGKFTIRYPDARKGHESKEETVHIDVKGDSHGGGDLQIGRASCRERV